MPDRFPKIENESGGENKWSFESTPGKAMEVADAVEERLRGLGWTEEQLGNFKVAIHEGIINAVVHGNEGDPAKKVDVELNIVKDVDGEEMAEITIIDEGKGFDPDTVPDPTEGENLLEGHGRGLYIMGDETDVAPEFLPNQGRLILRRKKDRPSDGYRLIKKRSLGHE